VAWRVSEIVKCAIIGSGLSNIADRRIVFFQLTANSGEIVVNRTGVDMCCHEGDEIRKCVGSGFNRKMMQITEAEIRIEGGRV
jgi:hypothetical protein